MGTKGARLTAIARRWAREIEQDPKLVASFLFRYARGDYHGDAVIPGLKALLSGVDNPISQESTLFETVELGKDRKVLVEISPPGAEDFRLEGITQLLAEQDPVIPYIELRIFLQGQGIPVPVWMDPEAKPQTAKKLSKNEIRKHQTQENYDRWQLEIDKKQAAQPGKSHAHYARLVARSPAGGGASAKTIANNSKLRKK